MCIVMNRRVPERKKIITLMKIFLNLDWKYTEKGGFFAGEKKSPAPGTKKINSPGLLVLSHGLVRGFDAITSWAWLSLFKFKGDDT